MTQQNLEWLAPPDGLVLEANEVHVWRASLEQPEPIFHDLALTLAGDEAARAARFHFDHHRRFYTVGRGILRVLLGRYLNVPPSSLQFSYGPQDKPALAEPFKQHNLQFNLSHSHEEALYAFTYKREIGVDIEQIRPISDAESIARRFFSARDTATFLSLPPDQRDEGFFNCWTRKEAYIKALGEGLSHPLDTFDVSLRPGEPAQLLAVREDAKEVARWSMLALTPVSGYVAALIVEGDEWSLRRWDWEKLDDL